MLSHFSNLRKTLFLQTVTFRLTSYAISWYVNIFHINQCYNSGYLSHVRAFYGNRKILCNLMQRNKYHHNPYLSGKIIHIPPISSYHINPCIRFHYSNNSGWDETSSWWHYQMETFSALLALCAGNSPVTVQFPSQRPVGAKLWCFLWSAPEKTVG